MRVAAVLDQRRHHALHGARRNSKADSRRRAARAEDRRVDAHDLALEIEQRPSGITRVDRRVGLDRLADEALIRALDHPSQRAHHADR